MTEPTAPETTDALDHFEERARALATDPASSAADWHPLFLDLFDAPPASLSAQAPPLDPDQARRSTAELRQLLMVLSPPAAQRPPPAQGSESSPGTVKRAGYSIEGEQGSTDARVRPALAEALARRAAPADLCAEFPDLWAIDAELWRLLTDAATSVETLARAWLVSPGRRLVLDLAVLQHLPKRDCFGASNFSPTALQAATGSVDSSPASHFAEWRELHLAVPGHRLAEWQPAKPNDVTSALRLLEGRRGDPAFLRAAALAWLLRRTATAPFYKLDGMERDLREDLVPALVMAFPHASADVSETRLVELRAAARFETVALHHAARIARRDGSPDALARCWSLARWIQSCTFRSPFFGGDELALVARLRALLPEEPTPSDDSDVLDPSRFRDNGTGLDIEELALVAGAFEHYAPASTAPKLLPTPQPLVQSLRRVAHRPLNAGEREVEERYAQDSSNALGWGGHHIAPPLVARWLMTWNNISWMQSAPPDVLLECFKFFAASPERFLWVPWAVHAEGRHLATQGRELAAQSWRHVVQQTSGNLGEQGELAAMAAGVLDQLTEAEANAAVKLALTAKPDWRRHVLVALAEAAERQEPHAETWRAALEHLMAMLADEQINAQERLKAALLALRQVSATRRPDRKAYLERLAGLVGRPPFIQNVTLRRELRRLGLLASNDSRESR